MREGRRPGTLPQRETAASAPSLLAAGASMCDGASEAAPGGRTQGRRRRFHRKPRWGVLPLLGAIFIVLGFSVWPPSLLPSLPPGLPSLQLPGELLQSQIANPTGMWCVLRMGISQREVCCLQRPRWFLSASHSWESSEEMSVRCKRVGFAACRRIKPALSVAVCVRKQRDDD